MTVGKVGAGRGLADLRFDNTLLVFELLRVAGPLTRSAISEATGLTQPTVASILHSLKAENIVRSGSAVATGGRKAFTYSVNHEALKVIAVDVQVHEIRGAVVDIAGNISDVHIWPAEYGPDSVAPFTRQLEDMVAKLYEVLRSHKRQPVAIGISLPVFLAEPDGRVLFAPSIGGEGLAVVEPLESQYRIPVCADNDARIGVLSEVWWKRQDRRDTVVYLVADHGVGSGMFINGEVFRGRYGTVGDIGHAVIDPRGRQCRCGQVGCLETFVSFFAIKEMLAKAGVDTSQFQSLYQIVSAALAGNETISQALRDAAEYLSVAISILNVLLAPDAIYLGGALERAWDIIEPAIVRLQSRAPQVFTKNTQVRRSTYGEMASIMGAAALAFQRGLPAKAEGGLRLRANQ